MSIHGEVHSIHGWHSLQREHGDGFRRSTHRSTARARRCSRARRRRPSSARTSRHTPRCPCSLHELTKPCRRCAVAVVARTFDPGRWARCAW
ncbi:hypothetical protein WOLCODRAFT_141175, partial [Wolfiporia cocos MD-104 SS10]